VVPFINAVSGAGEAQVGRPSTRNAHAKQQSIALGGNLPQTWSYRNHHGLYLFLKPCIIKIGLFEYISTIQNFMDKKTTGAWVIHHTAKIEQASIPTSFDRIALAGKAGVLLSALSESNQQSQLTPNIVEALAQTANIRPFTELPTILDRLEAMKLIERSKEGTIEVLGLTTASILQHTADIFATTVPQNTDLATLDLAELVSQRPAASKEVKEYISDKFSLPQQVTTTILEQSEEIGFVDFETVDNTNKLYFNGNLFRRDNPKKALAILSSLSPTETRSIQDIEALFVRSVTIPYADMIKILGDDLFRKLHSIGVYDVNTVSNERETSAFITKPAAFSKYGNTLIDDALDLVKAFVTSLTYGMTYSPYNRGRITMLPLLLNKLIRGEWVGPATAIGHDYKVLEVRRVIQVKDIGGGRFSMRLLKRDVGELALQALIQGDISEKTLSLLQGASITNYTGPERNREVTRKKHKNQDNKSIIDLLRTIGG
jgi:hypothetical protein